MRGGYIDYGLYSSDTAGLTAYILENLLAPGESSPVFTSGLVDGVTLNKLFTQKRMLGISMLPTKLPNHILHFRLKLSKTVVLVNNGYHYHILLYAGNTYAASTFHYKIMGGKLYWDRIV